LGYSPVAAQSAKAFRSFRPVFALVVLGYILCILPDNFAFQPRPRKSVMQAVLMVAGIRRVIQVKTVEIQPFIYFQF
jgi:hypothetical protein